MRKASGGSPLGPLKLGPPVAEMSTNNAFRGLTRAIGSDTARVTVADVMSARSRRNMRRIFWRSIGAWRVSLRCAMLCASKLWGDWAGEGEGTGAVAGGVVDADREGR